MERETTSDLGLRNPEHTYISLSDWIRCLRDMRSISEREKQSLSDVKKESADFGTTRQSVARVVAALSATLLLKRREHGLSFDLSYKDIPMEIDNPMFMVVVKTLSVNPKLFIELATNESVYYRSQGSYYPVTVVKVEESDVVVIDSDGIKHTIDKGSLYHEWEVRHLRNAVDAGRDDTLGRAFYKTKEL